ncbi:pilus assembly protein PilM [Candidatus Dependentiae bacterium]|nr:pilus assembly protein PilM [Candidatus Dependentiae bacterium]
MIKRIFLPEKVGSYYLFDKRTIGIEIGLHEIFATTVLAKGHSRTIEKLTQEPIVSNGVSYDERVINALKALSHKMGRYDELCCIIPSSLVVFKNITLPFTGIKKTKMVIPFEVESMLPFTLDQAVLDSIITHEDTEKKQTSLIVGAVKKEIVDRYIHYFTGAGFPVQKISIGIFELYGLYKLIEEKNDTDEAVGLINMGYETTELVLLIQGQPAAIRSLPQGIISIAKKLGTFTQGDITENIQKLLRSGVDETRDTGFAHAAQRAFEDLIHEISFTYMTATKKVEPQQNLTKIILVGAAGDIPGIADFLTKELGIPSVLLEPKKLIHNAIIKSTVPSLSNNFMPSIAAAISTETTSEFNLHKQAAQKEETNTINKQLITSALLLFLLFFSFTLYSFFRLRNLRMAYVQAERESLVALKKNFKLKPNQTTTLAQANKAAQAELIKQETTWHRLSADNRYALLRYLVELSKCINLTETQLDLTSLILTDTTIKLYGSVPGYPQLTKLQSQLECPLFKRLPKLQDPNFKSEPITLTINKEEL